MRIVTVVLLLIATAALSASLIILLKPLLFRYALARPNGRSSHKEPTPQGAGIAVVAATLAGALLVVWLVSPRIAAEVTPQLLLFFSAVLALALIGLVDDISPLSPAVRLIGQSGAAMALLLALPENARALPWLPWVIEAAICVVGLVWFINLTNFMDGIDGMIVAGVVPILGGCALLALIDHSALSPQAAIALALAAALIGFAPFNLPVAQVFLGDVGSLAIGGIAGWLLLDLACSDRIVAALVLALYFLADTGATLYRRWLRGERLSQAHREHFYQRATANGWMVAEITGRVRHVGCALIVIAVLAGSTQSLLVQLAGLILALLIVADMLIEFDHAASPDQVSASTGAA